MRRILNSNFKMTVSTLAIFVFLFFHKTASSQIVGPTHVCTTSGFSYGIIDTCYNSYNWTVTPGIGVFFGPTNDFSVDVAWVNPGTAQLCVEVNDTCMNMPQTFCVSVLVETIIIPPTTEVVNVCAGDCFDYAGETYCTPGTYQIVWDSYMGCDSIVNLIINTVQPVFTNLGTVTVNCYTGFEICGQIFTTPGVYTSVCTSWQGCDSTVVVNLIPAGNLAAQAGPDVWLDCLSPTGQLNSNGSSPPNANFSWTGPNGFTSSEQNPIVTEPGQYNLTVTDLQTGCTASDFTHVIYDTVSILNILPATFPCDGSNFVLEATDILPGNSYQWTTSDGVIVSGGMTLNPTIGAAGTYCVVATDLTSGCTDQACVVVQNKVQLSVTAPEVVCGPGTYTFLLNIFSSQGPPHQLQYQINGVPQAPLVITSNPFAFVTQINGPSTFHFTAFDQSGCQSDPVVHTVNLDDFDIDFTVTQNSCQPVQVTASASGPFQNFGIEFFWDTGSQDSSIFVTQAGWYTLEMGDNYGCTRTDSVFVSPDFGGTCAIVEGFILEDELDNCTSDPGETPLAGWLVQAQGSSATFFGTTDADGYYFITVDPGNYTVSVFPPSQFWLPCSNDVPVSLPNADDVATVDFLVQPIHGCPAMTVDISTSLLRRCFSTNFYHVNYCNDGTAIATDAYVVVNFDPFLTLTNSNLSYTDLGGNAYQFDLGDVEPGDCGSFWAQVTVSCDAAIGQTHCTEAHIYPDTACVQTDPLWSGASIEIEADCTDSTRFILKNAGTGTMTVPLEYIVIEDAVMYRYDTGAPLGPGESMEVVLPSNGSTWRIEAEQEPLHPQPSQPVAFVEGCGVNPGGSFSLGFVNQFSLGDPEQFTDIDCTVNMGAFDPNDKSASPTGYRDEHFIAQNTEIEYLIRFQNTGTDTAFTVVIRDTLSPHLNVTTLRPGASSHAYEMEIYGQGIVKFTFPDIMLPDSNVNVEASQGFVQFKISPRDSLPVFTEIENSAAIYFDFNEPIITNTTLHTIEKPVVNTLTNVTLCAGEPFGGVVFTTDTLLVETFSFAQYDSMIWTDVRVLPVFSSNIQTTICEGANYLFNGQNLVQAGTYEAELTAANGCDSIVTLTLAVVENFEVEISAQICGGETYEFGNQQLTEPGEYLATYQTVAGCDSTVTLTLAVVENFEVEISTQICAGETYEFDNQQLTEPGVYVATYQTAAGCDSIVTLLLDVLIASQINISAEICEGESVIFNGEEISEPGQYEATLTSSMGCDSTVTLTLAVLPHVETNLSAEVCEGESYIFSGEGVSEPGTYSADFTAANGCDSTVTLQLAVLPTVADTIFLDLEWGMSYNGIPVFSDTTIIENLTAANGCDSTVTANITVVTGVKNTFGNDLNLSIFPNPASGVFFVKFELKQPENVSLRVLDLIGREVKFELEATRLSAGQQIVEIETIDWPGGVYLIHFQTSRGNWTGKLIVQ